MSKIFCVTNRTLCAASFLLRVEKIAAAKPTGIILREKDLSNSEYQSLAKEVLAICHQYQVPCILHTFVDVAIELKHPLIHLPLPILRKADPKTLALFDKIGASCHSVAEAVEAESLGATYITAGHIFATDCKKGLPGRGLSFLQSVVDSVDIPIYAIGGISPSHMPSIIQCGASGVCLMSSLMKKSNIANYLSRFSIES